MSLVRAIISAFNSNFALMLCVSRKRFYINIETPWCHKTYVLYYLKKNCNQEQEIPNRFCCLKPVNTRCKILLK